MICCSCHEQCAMSKNGLCQLCREGSYRPQMSRKLRTRAAARWTEGQNEVLLIRYHLTQRQAVDRSMVALMRMEKLFDRDTIFLHGLDNPYMAEHARKALIGYMLAAGSRRAGRKPAQPERPILAARKVAA